MRAVRYDLAAMITLVSSSHKVSQYGQCDGLLDILRCLSNGIRSLTSSTFVNHNRSPHLQETVAWIKSFNSRRVR